MPDLAVYPGWLGEIFDRRMACVARRSAARVLGSSRSMPDICLILRSFSKAVVREQNSAATVGFIWKSFSM